jgi:hypothetical protein
MKTITTCFTISFSAEQLEHAKSYVEDMKKHPKRIFWKNRVGKSDEELIYEQMTNRILSGYYGDDFFLAQKSIERINSKAENGMK